MDRERSPRRPHPRRSNSPERRDYETKGGGRSSSRNRSPGFYSSSNATRPPPRDSGYTSRDSRDRRRSRGDEPEGGYEWGTSGASKRRRGDEAYSEKDREKERAGERERFDVATKEGDGEVATVQVEKPNFGHSGLLAKETNTVKGVEMKYNEPPEARKPLKNWRLYVFKGKEQLDLIHIYKQSCYLVGRDTVVTDIPIAHPSCSKQHAAIQFRQISEKNEFGEVTTSVKPFVIDLESTNGTYVNDEEIPKTRYYELRNSDVIKFGTSSREYVLLHEDASA
ncbi:SMAD/FHA domain-containing protein [Naematelia encephala]|uniref:SMAD/FHA domain-containing protein n=1 Tax=Naematelia encephala TaxID=71784 RepID=A0A1Y2BF80_9TREE|nr:SMAD/FHA domain-containing protein [Naematelia encephala]